MHRVAILGGGGFAREVRALIRAINAVRPTFSVVGLVVRDAEVEHGGNIVGDQGWLASHADSLDGLVLGIGQPAVRSRVFEQCRSEFPALDWPTLIHPTVGFDPESCHFGRGTIVCAGTNLTVNVVVGDFVLCNLNCTVGHEAAIGDFSVINPGSNISGGVRIGKRVLVGTGARILENLVVGDDSTVGAGAVVTRPVESGRTVVGVPARPRTDPVGAQTGN